MNAVHTGMRMRSVGLALVLGGWLGCQGEIGEVAAERAVVEPAFESPPGGAQLLPFWVRLQRVATVAGVTVDDEILSDLLENRTGLGDYDYAHGVQPDRLWSSARITLWAKSLRRVCTSDAMRTKYPALDTAPDFAELAVAAWGRDVSEEEAATWVAPLRELDEPDRYLLGCLAVLSATEFVLQ